MINPLWEGVALGVGSLPVDGTWVFEGETEATLAVSIDRDLLDNLSVRPTGLERHEPWSGLPVRQPRSRNEGDALTTTSHYPLF